MPSLENLAELATKAAAVQQSLDDAIQASTAAEVAAIEAIIASVQPALRSIACRPKVHYRSWWIGNTHTDSESESYPTKGFKLVGGRTCHEDGTGNSGDVRGSNVYLMTTGTLLKFEYSGHWSSWQGSSDEWEAEVTPLSISELVSEYCIKAEDLAAKLGEAFEGVIKGKAVEKTKRNLDRVEQLEAITTLLKK